MVQVALREL